MTDTSRMQLAAELSHWQSAAASLSDLDVIAAPAAWAGLELYLSAQVRRRLLSVVTSLQLEASQAVTALNAGADLAVVRRLTLQLRQRYVQAETVLDFYGDAINTRTVPALAALLRGLDRLAGDALESTLRPLGLEAPPVLVYLDKGLGASILRAGIRLWDEANPSPAAAIKITRHNLLYPTALLHEAGHQFAHLTGWTTELARQLGAALESTSSPLADMWAGWASEVAADVYAFALGGWAPVPALANVVDGSTPMVYRRIVGDPHPYPIVPRAVQRGNVPRAGTGPGRGTTSPRRGCNDIDPLTRRGATGELTRQTMAALPAIVDVCTRRPMHAFRDRPLHAVADPMRVAPAAVRRLVERAGTALVTSPHLARHETMPILAWLSTRAVLEPTKALEHQGQLRSWLVRLGTEPTALAA